MTTTRGGAVAARLAHNQQVAGAIPAPATLRLKKNSRSKREFFIILQRPVFVSNVEK